MTKTETLTANLETLTAELEHMRSCNCHGWNELTAKMQEFDSAVVVWKLACLVDGIDKI